MSRLPTRVALSRVPSRIAIVISLLLAALWWSAGPILPVHAATDTVSVCDGIHLQGAIFNAAPGDTVNFACSGTITLTGTILLGKNLTIDGSGQKVTISGGSINYVGGVRVFEIDGGLGVGVTLNDLVITGGYGDGRGGGAILNAGTLTINNSTVSDSITGGDQSGGGIDNAGTLTINNSTLSGNTTNGVGGGIYNIGTLTIHGSTLSQNSIHDLGGGEGGGIFNGGTLSVTNSTFSGNYSNGVGGGIFSVGGDTLSVTNSTFKDNNEGNIAGYGIVANTILAGGATAGSPYGPNCPDEHLIDNGGNLSDDNSCGFTQGSSKNNATDLRLGPLGDNGGPTQTIALVPGSSAIDVTSCLLPTDQRGAPRPVAGESLCDSGAYEFQDTPVNNPVVTICNEAALRTAIFVATAGSTLTFSCSGPITLSSAEGCALTVNKNLTIDGVGQKVTISGGNTAGNLLPETCVAGVAGNPGVPVLEVSSGVTATLARLTITQGGALNQAGGIYNLGTLTLRRITVSGNTNAGAGGGGIGNAGTLTVINSTISGNLVKAGPGGGIYNHGALTISNSTVSGNRTSVSFGPRGGIWNGSPQPMTITNSILAGNTGANCVGVVTDSGGNLSDDNTCGFTRSSSKNNATGLNLGPLADNGGPTQTIALLPGSVAIDFTSCLRPTDQRGAPRPVPGHPRCSSGAFEFGSTVPASTAATVNDTGLGVAN